MIICEKHGYTEAVPQLLQALNRQIDVFVGGGSEYAALKSQFTRTAWHALVQLTHIHDLPSKAEPTRAMLEEMKKRVAQTANTPAVSAASSPNASPSPTTEALPRRSWWLVGGALAAIVLGWLALKKRR